MSVFQGGDSFFDEIRWPWPENNTPSVRKYKTFRGKNPKISEIKKNSIIFSSTQPKEEFPCAFCWVSLKVRGSSIFT